MSEEEKERNITVKDIKGFLLLFADQQVIQLFQLSSEEKEILELVWYEQMTFAEIAAQHNVTSESVGQIYLAATEKFNKNFKNVVEQLKAFDRLKLENNYLKKENTEFKRMIASLSIEKRMELWGDSELKNIPIWELGLELRACYALKRLKINTLADLTSLSKADLLKTKNFGEKSHKTLQGILDKYCIKLKD